MAEVTYENDASLLSFMYGDVLDALARQISNHGVKEDSMLLEWLKEKSDGGESDIRITHKDQEAMPEYVSRIVYVIRDLLSEEKGTVYCKECDRRVPASEIKRDEISPFDFYKGVDKKTVKALKKELGIKGKMRLPGGSGGTSFYCKNGHHLFGTTDWVV